MRVVLLLWLTDYVLPMVGNLKPVSPANQSKFEILMFKIFMLFKKFLSAGAKAESDTKPIAPTSSPTIGNTPVGSRIFSCPPKRLGCIDKHWSEMSGREKVEAGPFICFVKPDEYDKCWGVWLEYMILYNDVEEYYKLKNFVIEQGRLEEFLQPPRHHKNQ